ncbi:HAD family hydrolase [Pelagibacteraceae bacterium]|nr:HAD family hydrolase [Pelagibacteraceae bacterium]MDC0413223.1 HAD family hydrolase [Pelagibacteraceae bacterium]
MKNLNKCVFLDRDGVLNKDVGYISKIKEFEIYPFTAKAIKLLNDQGYLVILITNQAGVGRGLITLKQLNSIHMYLKKMIKKNKAIINDIYFCPFHPTHGIGKYKKNTQDRKPGSGMIKKAVKKWNIDINNSFMIGDRKKDLLSAKGAGVKFYYKSKKKNLYQQVKEVVKKK